MVNALGTIFVGALGATWDNAFGASLVNALGAIFVDALSDLGQRPRCDLGQRDPRRRAMANPSPARRPDQLAVPFPVSYSRFNTSRLTSVLCLGTFTT